MTDGVKELNKFLNQFDLHRDDHHAILKLFRAAVESKQQDERIPTVGQMLVKNSNLPQALKDVFS